MKSCICLASFICPDSLKKSTPVGAGADSGYSRDAAGLFRGSPMAGMEGHSLLPVISRDEKIHDAVLFGIFGGHLNVTDGEWVYMRANRSADNQPLAEYTLMPTHMREFFSPEELNGAELVRLNQFSHHLPVLRIPCQTDQNSALYGDFLFHLVRTLNRNET